MLSASETGSCGGDAARLLQILEAALEGALLHSKSAPEYTFQHLLGWTAAANNHELDMLFERGEPELTQSVFALAAKEWKKLFERTEVNGAIPGVSDELRNFAISVCDSFHKLLKSQRKIHGEHAKYSFYFIKPKSRGGVQQHKTLGMEAITKEPVEKEPKKHAGKKPKVATETKGCIDGPINFFVAGQVVCADDVMAATVAARTAIDTPPDPTLDAKSSSTSDGLLSKGVGFYDNNTVISITIPKRGKSAKLGIGLSKVAGPAQCSAMKVTTIFESSLFYNTGLRIGMIIFLVNGTIYTDFDHGLEMLQNEKGKLSIVAAFPRQGVMVDSADSKSTVGDNLLASAGTTNTTPGAGPIFVSFPPIFHCIAGVNSWSGAHPIALSNAPVVHYTAGLESSSDKSTGGSGTKRNAIN